MCLRESGGVAESRHSRHCLPARWVDGGRLADGQEICERATCQRKRADLERHLAYKQAVAGRNHERLCGRADCSEQAAGQCSKCQGLFCFGHLEEREIEERSGATVVRVRGSLCRHCLQRRTLWSRA